MVLHLACPARRFQTPQDGPFQGSSWRSGSLSLSTSSSVGPQASSSPPLCLPGSSPPHCVSFVLHYLPQTSQQPAKFIHPVFWGDGAGSMHLFSCLNARRLSREDVCSQWAIVLLMWAPPRPRMPAPDKAQVAGEASLRRSLPSAGLPPSTAESKPAFLHRSCLSLSHQPRSERQHGSHLHKAPAGWPGSLSRCVIYSV